MIKLELKLLFIFAHACLVLSTDFRVRHEYKYSFKGPSLTQGRYQIPFWDTNGDSVSGSDQIRIVPSLRDKTGGVWSKYGFTEENWQVEMSFRIHGRGKIGADGMVVWFVEKPSVAGPVFGSMDQWKGLGIFLDSYDNDGGKNNPYISVIVNDGTKAFNHHLDGSDMKLGGCFRDFRNRVYPSKLRLTYWQKTLKVEIDPGNMDQTDYEHCSTVEGIELPKDNFFGMTAATGGLADDHDVISFTTYSLHEHAAPPEGNVDEEAAKHAQEEQMQNEEEESYKKKMEEFRTEAKKFREEHPDLVRAVTPDPNSIEESSSPELRSILDVQSQIKTMMTSSLKAMGTIMKRQDEMMPKIAEAAKRGDKSESGGSQATLSDYASKEDMKNIVDSIKLSVTAIDELQNKLNHIADQSTSLQQVIQQVDSRVGGLAMKQQAPSGTAGAGDAKTRQQLDYLSSLVLDVQAKQKNPPKLSCPVPPPSSCLTPGFFLLMAIIQIVILLGYQMMKASQEAAAKKFF